MGALIKTVHSVCECVCVFMRVCLTDEASLNGSRKALHVDMDASFMFIRKCVGRCHICLLRCFSNEGNFNVDE